MIVAFRRLDHVVISEVSGISATSCTRDTSTHNWIKNPTKYGRFLLDFTTSRFAPHLCYFTPLSVSFLRDNEKFPCSPKVVLDIHTNTPSVDTFGSAIWTAITTQNILR